MLIYDNRGCITCSRKNNETTRFTPSNLSKQPRETLLGLAATLINRATPTNRYIHYLAPATIVYLSYLSIGEKSFVKIRVKFVNVLQTLDHESKSYFQVVRMEIHGKMMMWIKTKHLRSIYLIQFSYFIWFRMRKIRNFNEFIVY